MSLSYLLGDAITLTQLVLRMYQNTRKACREYDELSQESCAMEIALQRLEQELSKPESPLNLPGDSYTEEIGIHIRGCREVLRVLKTVLEQYIELSGTDTMRTWRKLYQQIKFGNGEVGDLQDLRSKMCIKTSASNITLHMASLDSLGRIEKQMNRYLPEMKIPIHGTAARLIANSNDEASILTSYADDEKSVWDEFRKDLTRKGFSSSRLKRYRALIMAYTGELVDRGLFDVLQSGDFSEGQDSDRHEQLPAEYYSSSRQNEEDSSRDQRLITSLNVNRANPSEERQGHYSRGAVYTDKYPNKYPDTFPKECANTYPNTYPNTLPKKSPNTYPDTFPKQYPNTHLDTYPNTFPDPFAEKYLNPSPNPSPYSFANMFPNAANINIALYPPEAPRPGSNPDNKTRTGRFLRRVFRNMDHAAYDHG